MWYTYFIIYNHRVAYLTRTVIVVVIIIINVYVSARFPVDIYFVIMYMTHHDDVRDPEVRNSSSKNNILTAEG